MTLHGKMPAPASTPHGRPTVTATTRVIYSARFPETATHWNDFQSTFNQDLNGDGVTGLNPLVIQTDTSALGLTSLAQMANNYFLFAAGGTTGPELQYNGAAVTSGKVWRLESDWSSADREWLRMSLGSGRTAISLQSGRPTAAATTQVI